VAAEGRGPASDSRSLIASFTTMTAPLKPIAPVPALARGSVSACPWPQAKRRSPIDTKPHKRLKLLFADDERSLQELMSLELPRLGHEVTVCPDGATAVAALEKN